MEPRVYIETSIPSFYHEARTAPDMVARRDWTRDWWDNHRQSYLLVTSEAVLDELTRGDYPNKEEALLLVNDVSLLEIDDPITEIVEAYVRHKLMPQNPLGDALHLALASYYKCDFLLTWNCKHLANANKFDHIGRVNMLLGLYVPKLVTPLELLGG
jgi:predicted nucleic acid-binding protein